MESQNTNPIILDEATWKNHILKSQEFESTNTEYCKIHGLKLSTFSGYKKKYGFTNRRTRAPRKFIKINPDLTPPIPTVSIHDKTNCLPDPKWLAEIVKSLMRS